MKGTSSRAISVIFFVATVAISVFAATKYNDLLRSVDEQRKALEQRGTLINRQQQIIAYNVGLVNASRERLSHVQGLIAAQREQIGRNARLLRASQIRLTDVQAENREGQVLIAHQREQIESNARSLRESETRLAEMSSRLATTDSAIIYVEGGSRTMISVGTTFGRLCEEGQAPASYCSSMTEFIPFMRLITAALQERMAAANSGHYEEMKADYQAALQLLESRPDQPWKAAWRAYTIEGIAYADMKLGRLAEAEASITPVAAQFGGFGRVTALKIMCLQRRPATQVQEDYVALMRRLEALVEHSQPDTEAGRSARFLRDSVVKDTELYLLCNYANLRPVERRPN